MITEKFAAAAEEIRPQLFRSLRSLGASRSDAEDAAQEALLQHEEHQVPFTDSDDLCAGVTPFARRARCRRRPPTAPRRGTRRRACREAESALEAVEWRDVLRTVAAALSRMSPADRTPLDSSHTGHDHRAARRLAARCAPTRTASRPSASAVPRGAGQVSAAAPPRSRRDRHGGSGRSSRGRAHAGAVAVGGRRQQVVPRCAPERRHRVVLRGPRTATPVRLAPRPARSTSPAASTPDGASAPRCGGDGARRAVPACPPARAPRRSPDLPEQQLLDRSSSADPNPTKLSKSGVITHRVGPSTSLHLHPTLRGSP